MDLHHALPPPPFPPQEPPRRRPRRPVDSLRHRTSSSGRHLAALRRLPLLNLPAGARQRCAAEPPRLPFGPPRDVRRVLEPLGSPETGELLARPQDAYGPCGSEVVHGDRRRL
ncbi:hypothetical protein Ahy_B04g070088 isoform B [Arachis hypogaea]|uniref:Uncharacterized protein n=1 Tax=Arachis hypogaea TaxID=3818 RepID=A0A444ZEP6_ARAHY|nr:hypothetical protein Ahy_B04g070088 isoform B [Arachis hypogaea]